MTTLFACKDDTPGSGTQMGTGGEGGSTQTGTGGTCAEEGAGTPTGTGTQVGTGIKPCTTTASMILGTATTMEAGGLAVLLETAKGVTDGSPPGTWSVQDAGQSSVEAT